MEIQWRYNERIRIVARPHKIGVLSMHSSAVFSIAAAELLRGTTTCIAPPHSKVPLAESTAFHLCPNLVGEVGGDTSAVLFRVRHQHLVGRSRRRCRRGGCWRPRSPSQTNAQDRTVGTPALCKGGRERGGGGGGSGGAAGSRIALPRTFVAGRRRFHVIVIVHRRGTARGGGRKASDQQEHVARDATREPLICTHGAFSTSRPCS